MSESVRDKTAENNSNESQSKTKNSIFFIGGEKGGVGKSFMARSLVDYFIRRGWKESFYLVEGDPTMKDVANIFPDNYEKVRFSDSKYAWSEPDIIIERIEEKTAVVNLASNVMQQFDSWIERERILSLKKKYCQDIVYFFVSDGCWNSMQLFLRQLKNYDTKEFTHCLVLNTGRLTNSGDFSYLSQLCPELINALKKHHVPTIYLPELSATAQFICDRTNMSYGSLKNAKKEKLEEELVQLVPNKELLKKMSKQISGLSIRNKLYNYVEEIDEIFQKIFPNSIENPEGLKSIYEKQKAKLAEGYLPGND